MGAILFILKKESTVLLTQELHDFKNRVNELKTELKRSKEIQVCWLCLLSPKLNFEKFVYCDNYVEKEKRKTFYLRTFFKFSKLLK